jgi:hypothetical protein
MPRRRQLTSAGKDSRQVRRLNATGFAFAVVGRGELLMLLLFKAMLLLERARGRKAGGPPLLAPSFKVQRNTAHNQSSGFAVAPRVKGLNARGPLKVQQGDTPYCRSWVNGGRHGRDSQLAHYRGLVRQLQLRCRVPLHLRPGPDNGFCESVLF